MNKLLLLCVFCWASQGCEGAKATPTQPAPAHVQHPAAPDEIGVVRFTRAAALRLGLATARVENLQAPATRLVGGEVIVPPGRTITVTAPVSGELRATPGSVSLTPGVGVARGQVVLKLVPFAAIDRDVRARVERELAAGSAQLAAAESRVSRLSQAGADQIVSRRAYEEAVAARDIMRADQRAAEARAQNVREAPLLSDVALAIKAPSDGVVRVLAARAGQAVAAGALLFELVAVEALQVRVPVYGGDLARLDISASARVRGLSSPPHAALLATPTSGPPTAAAERNTVDRYYALERGATFSPGERVLVELTMRDEQGARSVPASSLFYDASGAAWVYLCVGEYGFRRARIDPLRLSSGRVLFAHGPPVESCVASVGVSEILGTEFEPGH